VIFCQNKSPEVIYSSLIEAVDNINSWLLSINLELSIPKTHFIIFNRSRRRVFPDCLEIRGNPIIRQNTVKYLGIQLDTGLRWREHITYLKSKTAKYMNILKWLMGRCWGIYPLQAINFVNATILAQLLWGSMWYVNAAKNNLKMLDSILNSAYKFVLGLPKNSANRVCWSLLDFRSLGRMITKICDNCICRAYQL